jgi:hypothetical protein
VGTTNRKKILTTEILATELSEATEKILESKVPTLPLRAFSRFSWPGLVVGCPVGTKNPKKILTTEEVGRGPQADGSYGNAECLMG